MKFKTITFTAIFSILSFKSIGQTKLEKFINKIYDKIEGDSSNQRKNSFFPIPIWGVYPETGWQIGISLVYIYRHKSDSITRPSLIRLNTLYTQYDQYSLRPFIDIFTKNNQYNIKANYSYRKFNEYFWGLGSKSPETDKTFYNFDQNRLQLRVTKQFFKNVYIGLQTELNGVKNFDFSNDTVTAKYRLPGKDESFTSGIGFVVSFDNRNQIYFPSKGHLIDVTTLVNNGIFGSNFNYSNLTIDARKYMKLWNENILAFQGFFNLNEGNIPFRQLAVIGSDSYMRGYYNGRYRDNHAMAFQTELRKKVWGPISLAFFVGMGNVANEPAKLLNNLKPNYGLGIRAIGIRKDHLNIRIDYGRGENNIQGFYFTMGEAF